MLMCARASPASRAIAANALDSISSRGKGVVSSEKRRDEGERGEERSEPTQEAPSATSWVCCRAWSSDRCPYPGLAFRPAARPLSALGHSATPACLEALIDRTLLGRAPGWIATSVLACVSQSWVLFGSLWNAPGSRVRHPAHWLLWLGGRGLDIGSVGWEIQLALEPSRIGWHRGSQVRRARKDSPWGLVNGREEKRSGLTSYFK